LVCAKVFAKQDKLMTALTCGDGNGRSRYQYHAFKQIAGHKSISLLYQRPSIVWALGYGSSQRRPARFKKGL
jgi:hypothetical protein